MLRHPLFVIGFMIAAAIGGVMTGHRIDAGSQGALIEGLRNTSAIIFGVMGAWIAIVYPESLKKIVVGTKLEEEKHSRLIGDLLLPMIAATAVLATILLGQPIAEVVMTSQAYQDNSALFMRTSFGGICALTAFLSWALLMSLIPIGVADIRAGVAHDKKKRRRRIINKQDES